MVIVFMNQIVTSLNQASLIDIGIKNVKLWNDLITVYGDPAFTKLSEVFPESVVFIDWLREVTHGMDKTVTYITVQCVPYPIIIYLYFSVKVHMLTHIIMFVYVLSMYKT